MIVSSMVSRAPGYLKGPPLVLFYDLVSSPTDPKNRTFLHSPNYTYYEVDLHETKMTQIE